MAKTRVSVRLRLDHRQMDRFLSNTRQASVHRAGLRTKERMQQNITRTGRVDTGLMRDSVSVSRTRSDGPSTTSVSVGIKGKAANYAPYQEHGTRAHGPVRAPFMVFKPKGSNVVVFAKWVRGVKAAHFARDAYRALTVDDYLPR